MVLRSSRGRVRKVAVSDGIVVKVGVASNSESSLGSVRFRD